MSAIRIKLLAKRVQERRGTKGIREAAGEVGVSPATLSRVENGRVPDLETFSKICRWLGEDPAIYLGLTPLQTEPERVRRLLLDAAHKAITEKRIERLEQAFVDHYQYHHRRISDMEPGSMTRLERALGDVRRDLADGEREGGVE